MSFHRPPDKTHAWAGLNMFGNMIAGWPGAIINSRTSALLLPWFLTTLLLLIYRALHKVFINPGLPFSKLISMGVLFGGLIWLFMLPLIYVAHKRTGRLGVTPFLFLQSLLAILFGLLHTYAFVYGHHLFWPHILDPGTVLTPFYVLTNVRFNFFIYWILIAGLYLHDRAENHPTARADSISPSKKLLLGNIAFVKASGNYIIIYSIGQNDVTIEMQRQSMHDLEQSLPFPMFLRVHRSFIINRAHIHNFKKSAHGEYSKEGCCFSNNGVAPI